jgi:hypothetical protein
VGEKKLKKAEKNRKKPKKTEKKAEKKINEIQKVKRGQCTTAINNETRKHEKEQ